MKLSFRMQSVSSDPAAEGPEYKQAGGPALPSGWAFTVSTWENRRQSESMAFVDLLAMSD
ncbi:hypothetical protein ACVIDN_001235 [Rhizobium brockwellii]